MPLDHLKCENTNTFWSHKSSLDCKIKVMNNTFQITAYLGAGGRERKRERLNIIAQLLRVRREECLSGNRGGRSGREKGGGGLHVGGYDQILPQHTPPKRRQ